MTSMTFEQAKQRFAQRRADDFARFAQWGIQHGDTSYANDMQVLAAEYATKGELIGAELADRYFSNMQ
jgi:hypothetical protein